MKILLVTNKVKTYALGFKNTIDVLNSLGLEIVWAADFSAFVGNMNDIPCLTEQISIKTNPFHPNNIKTYFQLCYIIRKHRINAIQCSTPIGGLLGRLAGLRMRISPVIYAAHGFLFFKGAPLLNRTAYKWEEIILAHFTDVLITITDEDYQEAKKFSLRNGKKLFLVHGAGVNTGVKVDINKEMKRKEIGVPENCFLVVSAGELNKNKNTAVIINALKKVDNMHYVACGVGPEKENLERLAKDIGVSDRFHLVGYRTDVAEIMSCADAFTMMSFREGMPRALLEAMDLGLPCVGSNTRGIRDLIDSDGGIICTTNNPDSFAEAFNKLRLDLDLRKSMGDHNKKKVYQYSSDIVKSELNSIYTEELLKWPAGQEIS